MHNHEAETLPGLAEFQALSSVYLRAYLKKKILELKKISPFFADIIQKHAPLLIHSGKRLRPYLCVLGYATTGKQVTSKILRASLSLELLHVFALIHDDMIDDSDQRRGYPTLHVSVSHLHQKKRFHGESKKFGEAYALLVGDLLSSFTDDLLIESLGSSPVTIKALHFIEQMRQDVIAGQAQDVLLSANLGGAREEDVMKMLRYKSGAYTVERPLQLGCLLGNGSKKVSRALSRFSIPLGVAFQIRDDILGTFGDQTKVGKPVDSDIKEGKATLVAVHALRHASRKQKNTLIRLLGKKQATRRETEAVRNIFLSLGSDVYAHSVAQKLLKKATKELITFPVSVSLRETFRRFADFLVSRSQ